MIVALAVARPTGKLPREAVRLLPDVLRLVHRLAADHDLPASVRVRLWLLLAYLAFPLDIVPDFIPVLGYADDAIIIAAVLRAVIRRAGPRAVRAHWPGTEEGFAALTRVAGLAPPTDHRSAHHHPRGPIRTEAGDGGSGAQGSPGRGPGAGAAATGLPDQENLVVMRLAWGGARGFGVCAAGSGYVATGRLASRHSRMPSVSRFAGRLCPVSSRTASWASTQCAPRQ